MRPWTVLLLYPEHATDDYGLDTYRTFVNAWTPTQALAEARAEVRTKYDELEAPEASEFKCLSLVAGHHISYDDGDGGVSNDIS